MARERGGQFLRLFEGLVAFGKRLGDFAVKSIDIGRRKGFVGEVLVAVEDAFGFGAGRGRQDRRHHPRKKGVPIHGEFLVHLRLEKPHCP